VATPIVLCKSFNASVNSAKSIELPLERVELCKPSPNRNDIVRFNDPCLELKGDVGLVSASSESHDTRLDERGGMGEFPSGSGCS
jgi:hypothetical protein